MKSKALTLFLTIKGLERDVGVAEKQHQGIGEALFAGVQASDKPIIRRGKRKAKL